MKLLFICSQGRNRSRTAAEMYADTHETRSKALYNPYKKLGVKDLEWADLILVMQEHHKKTIKKIHPAHYSKNKVVNLNIPDAYAYQQPELKKILEKKVSQALRGREK